MIIVKTKKREATEKQNVTQVRVSTFHSLAESQLGVVYFDVERHLLRRLGLVFEKLLCF